MNDCRKIVINALGAALETATGKTVYSKIPKQLASIFPYIHIAEVFMQEEGTKKDYQYKFDILIEICHKNEDSDSDLYSDMDKVCQVINNAVPFALTGEYSIMDMRLNNSVKTEVLTESGQIDVGAIRLIIRVE